jgi:hypothetical protein
MSDLYERDFYAWSSEQAALLRSGKLDVADIANIAEEIETLGRSEKRELVSRLTVLLLHRLKLESQPDRRSRSWELSTANARDAISEHLDDNPSLKTKLPDSMATAYRYARREAAIETGLALDAFPPDCPRSFDQAMQDTL